MASCRHVLSGDGRTSMPRDVKRPRPDRRLTIAEEPRRLNACRSMLSIRKGPPNDMILRILCMLAAILTHLPVEATDALRYRVTAPAGLDRLDVTVCLGTWTPRRLKTRTPEAERFLVWPEPADGSPEVRVRDGEIHLRANAGDCFRYGVDLAAALEEEGGRMIVAQGADRLLGSGLWLWRPEHIPPDADTRVSFQLPAGYRVSVPWEAAGDDNAGPTFHLGRTPASWRDLMAIGRFDVQEVAVPGARLRVSVLDGDHPAEADDMKRWIAEAANAVATLYGSFPLASPQVLVVPRGESGEAVPWAQVLRGGGAAAHFFVDASRPLSEFSEDWTAAHEFSHMLMPYIHRDDAWLSEGFASYYQNVLRARAGMLDPEQAWDKLYKGFQRGRDGTRGKTLSEASRSMGRDRAFMRVYWSGAAIALAADVELRRRTGGAQSLDTAMAALRDCCLPSERAWTGREVFDRLDRLTGDTVFRELYDAHVPGRRFPDVGEVSASLGIVERGDRLRFRPDPEAEALRDAIMSPPHRFSHSERLLDQQETAIH